MVDFKYYSYFIHAQIHMNQSNDSLSDKNLTTFLLSQFYSREGLFYYVFNSGVPIVIFVLLSLQIGAANLQ